MDISGKYWGTTRQVFFQNNVEMHYLQVMPGGFCSEHSHRAKFNRFVVIRGRLDVQVWKTGADAPPDTVTLGPFDECTVRPGIVHKFVNRSNETCELLELYWTQLDAHDIERLTVGGVDAPGAGLAERLSSGK